MSSSASHFPVLSANRIVPVSGTSVNVPNLTVGGALICTGSPSTATPTLSGPWGATTYTDTVYLTKLGNTVFARFVGVAPAAASAATVITSTAAIPAAYRPAAALTVSFNPTDNSVMTHGYITINTNGTYVIGCHPGGVFTAAGTAGYVGTMVTWVTN